MYSRITSVLKHFVYIYNLKRHSHCYLKRYLFYKQKNPNNYLLQQLSKKRKEGNFYVKSIPLVTILHGIIDSVEFLLISIITKVKFEITFEGLICSVLCSSVIWVKVETQSLFLRIPHFEETGR